MEITAAAPPEISRFEANLLTILRSFLGFGARGPLLSLLGQVHERPKCLSRTAVRLVEDSLSKGITLRLAEFGWRNERFVRDGETKTGRLWQRWTPAELGLTFSKASLNFLIWCTATQCDRSSEFHPQSPLTIGDRLLLALAFDVIRGSDAAGRWSRQSTWRNDALCQLLFPSELDVPASVSFDAWLTPRGQCILEVLQGEIAKRWLVIEQRKQFLKSPVEMTALGSGQQRVLNSLLDALDRAKRRDLARWLLILLRDLFKHDVTLTHWTGSLVFEDVRLAQRQEAYRHALAVVETAQRLAEWQQHARHLGYFDEDYQAAQLWKADWEAYNGETTVQAARELLRASTPA